MSFDIYAIVPADRWPTFAEINNAMRLRNYPAALEGFDAPDEPVRPVPSIDMRFGLTAEQIDQIGNLDTGALVNIDGTIVEPDFGYDPIEPQTRERLNEALTDIGAPPELLKDGDMLVVHSGHSEAATWNAGVYLLCALILDFGGYGFELQGGGHGRAEFASELYDSLDLN